MRWRTLGIRCGLVATMACAAGSEDAVEDMVCEGYQVAAIKSLTFARSEGGVSLGFDLDDEVSTTSDSTCGGADVVDPNGVAGIDNALGAVLPLLDGTEAVALEPLIAQFIAEGELLLLVEVAGHEGGDETCPSVAVLRGGGNPLVGADATILGGQTFELDPDSEQAAPVTATVTSDGAVLASGLEVEMPVQIFSADLDLSILNATTHLEPTEDGGFSGVLAGGVPYQPLLDGLLNAAIDQSVKTLLQAVLPSVADLAPDENGDCTQLSAVIEIEAVPGFLYEP